VTDRREDTVETRMATASRQQPDTIQSSLATRFQDLLRQDGFGEIQVQSTARTITVSAANESFSVFFYLATGPLTKSNIATATVVVPPEALPVGPVIVPSIPTGNTVG
jgi:hypothetical protein